MKRQDYHSWLTAPNVGWAWVLSVCCLWSLALTLAMRTEAGAYLDARISLPVDFQVRHWLGRDTPLSPHLKIYVVDDGTFAAMGSWVLSIDDWNHVLSTVAARRPRAIVIDGMFSKGDDLEGNAAAFAAMIKSLPVPVVVGAFPAPINISFRTPLNLDRPEYRLSSYFGREPDLSGTGTDELPPLVDRSKWRIYGPSRALQSAFQGIGHITYTGYGTVAPLLKVSADHVLAHSTLYAARERKISAGKLIIDGQVLPIDNAGNLYVNFLHPGNVYDIIKQMLSLLPKPGSQPRVPDVGPEDFVLFIPQFYTGNTDFKQTPFGAIPAGVVLASMLNSILTGNWLKPLNGEVLGVLAIVSGALLAMHLNAAWFWFTWLLTQIAMVILSQYLFAMHGIVVPWLLPLFGLASAGLTVYAKKALVGEKKAQLLRAALDGAVAADELSSIIKRPDRLNLEPRERVLTLMFIDVVGFSLMAEDMQPRLAFENLKNLLASIGEAIHQCGGIIDKTLGDGLLCYFGYHFMDDQSRPDHAEAALRCALLIQRDNIRRCLEAANSSEAVYPLRIGINTASCYLGDLGSRSRLDFTVVGNGVNFAKRLEGACEMHSVLVGATTHALVRSSSGLPSDAITRRLIRIKHHREPVEAFEYDPSHAEPEMKKSVLEAFQNYLDNQRRLRGWHDTGAKALQLRTDAGMAQIISITDGTLRLELSHLLPTGSSLHLTLGDSGGEIVSRLVEGGFSIPVEVDGEVKWGYDDGGRFVHGVVITSVDAASAEILLRCLTDASSGNGNEGEGDYRQGPDAKASGGGGQHVA